MGGSGSMSEEAVSFDLCADHRLHPYFLPKKSSYSRRARLLAHMALDRIESSLPTTMDLPPLREGY